MRVTTGVALRVYRREVSATLATGQASEHSYRPALQELVEGLGGDGLRAVNEPSQIDCGAPDFVVIRSGVPMGYIECKDLRTNLDRAEASEQIMRYRAGLPNLVLTDYLEFRRYADGELRETARLGRIDGQGGIIAEKDGAGAVGALLDAFLGADPPTIADPRELARRMASKARLLRDGIGRILRQEGRSGPLRDMLGAYREVLIAGLSDEAFADLQAQTAAYGLFAARCLQGARAVNRSPVSPQHLRTRRHSCVTCSAASLAPASIRASPGPWTTSHCSSTGPTWRRSWPTSAVGPAGMIR